MGTQCPTRLYILDSFMYLMAFSCQVVWGWRKSHQHCDGDMHLSPFFSKKGKKEKDWKSGRKWMIKWMSKSERRERKDRMWNYNGFSILFMSFSQGSFFSLFLSFLPFFFLLSPMGMQLWLSYSWFRRINPFSWNISVYGRLINGLYTVLDTWEFKHIREMNMVMQFTSRKCSRFLLDIYKGKKKKEIHVR